MIDMVMISAATARAMAGEGDQRDQGDAAVAALGEQVAEGDRPLPGAERRAREVGPVEGLTRRSPSAPRPEAGSGARRVARRLSSTTPSARPLGPDDQLPGQADQVHGGELAARALVGVVEQRLLAGGGQGAVGAARRPHRRRASPGRRLTMPTPNGATGVGPDDAGLVVAGLDDRRPPGARRRRRSCPSAPAARRRRAR